MMSALEQITIVGSGLMGHGIGQVFATGGYPVWLVDTDQSILDQAKEHVQANLTQMARHGISFEAEIDEIVDRLKTTTDLAQACQSCDFVIEAVYEDLALKQNVFADLDQLCPSETVLCSNTSVMSITQIGAKARHRERIIGTHFWNPPYLIPLVEVVRTEEAADWCLEAAYGLLERVGKHPVRVHRDVPGFVGNRLQHALWREAFAIIDEQICDPATIDEVIRNGFGLRLPILGPVENADMVGLDLTLAIHDYILKHINAGPTPSTTLRSNVAQGQLGFKTGHGFLEWSEADIAASRARLANYLLKIQVEQREEDRF